MLFNTAIIFLFASGTFLTNFARVASEDSDEVKKLTRRVELLSEPGWFYGGNDYQYWLSAPGVSVSRLQARRTCKGMGANLAMHGLRSSSSRQYIVDNILKTCGKIHGWWIDLNDQKTEGTFKWRDGKVLRNGDWANNQPDNINNADCVVIAAYFNFQWDDVPCDSSTTMGVLCERYIGSL